MRVIFIRHSLTKGNEEKRYIGKTDEPLCEKGIEFLKDKVYPICEKVYVSPMKRCRQTAEIIYNKQEFYEVEDFRECDFGIFENKNYLELNGNEDYQKWIDSNGELPFPQGESKKDFSIRCVNAFEKIIKDCKKDKISSVAFVVHGGTIMSILDRYSEPHKDYYSWQIKNAEYYECEFTEDNRLIFKNKK